MHPTTDTKQSDQRRVTSSHADEEQGEIRQRGPLVLGDMTAHVTEDAIPADAIIPRRQTVDAHAGQTHPDPDADGAASRIAERPAAIQQPFSRLNHDARHPARQSRDRPWLRGLIVLFIAAGVGAAAFISQSPLRDAAARWAPQVVSASSPPSARPVDVNSLATQAQVAAATTVAERLTTAAAVAVLMASPEIKSLSDLAGKSIAIDDKQSAASSNIRLAMAAAGAAEVQLTASQTRPVDRVIGGEVPASVLTLASPEAAEGFPEISGFKIFRLPLSERETRSR
jgi:hypothetical protein